MLCVIHSGVKQVYFNKTNTFVNVQVKVFFINY